MFARLTMPIIGFIAVLFSTPAVVSCTRSKTSSSVPGDSTTTTTSAGSPALPWYGSEEFLDIPWNGTLASTTVRILHISDTHFSDKSDASPWSDRMHNAFASTSHFATGMPTKPADEFKATLQRAEAEKVDLVAFGGDLVNFPSNTSVEWGLKQLNSSKMPYVFTAGNHDWHLERKFDWEKTYDAQRLPNEYSILGALYNNSGQGMVEKNFSDPRCGYGELKSGLLVVTVDNSNYQVDAYQLAFFSKMVLRNQPLLLVMHVPIHLPGLPPNWGPGQVMGHPKWGHDGDGDWELEKRLRWPEQSQSLNTTRAFIEAVKRAAKQGVLTAVLTGHTHENAVVPIPCPDGNQTSGCQSQAKQYTTQMNADGSSRLLQIRFTGATLRAPRAVSRQIPPTHAKPNETTQSQSDLSWFMSLLMLGMFGLASVTAVTGVGDRFILEMLQGKSTKRRFEFENSLAVEQARQMLLGGEERFPAWLPTKRPEAEMPLVCEAQSCYGTLDCESVEVLL